MAFNTPGVLIILDGCGIRKDRRYNCVELAETPFLDFLKGKGKKCLRDNYKEKAGVPFYTEITAVGPAVGMPEGAKGSTAVGHEVISGVDYKHPMLALEKMVKGRRLINEASDKAIDKAALKKGSLHFVGLVSNNREHSHIKHLYSLIRRAVDKKVKDIKIHFITDGRGTPPHSAPSFAEDLEEFIGETVKDTECRISIATVVGRDTAMNRAAHSWNKTEETYRAIAEGRGKKEKDLTSALKKDYDRGLNDQYISVRILGDYKGLKENDSVIFWNFRKDRMEFLARMFLMHEDEISSILRDSEDTSYGPDFIFRRETSGVCSDYSKINFCALAEYYSGIGCPVILREPDNKWSLGRVLSDLGLKQFRISGVDKAKAVALLSGGKTDKIFKGEKRITVPLPEDTMKYIINYDREKGGSGYKLQPYENYPQIELPDLTGKFIELINDEPAGCFLANFCNPDMVGHTANVSSGILAMEEVDKSLERVALHTVAKGGFCIITADHGNLEELITDDDEPNTFHTANKVPFIILGKGVKELRPEGNLSDVAPTFLDLLLDEEVFTKYSGFFRGKSLLRN
ncbi:MAG: hypothetical protein ACLFQK_07015 [Fibrobacterota bacterium]